MSAGIASDSHLVEPLEHEDGAARELLAAALALPYRQRVVIVARCWGGWSESEIADALGCRPGTGEIARGARAGAPQEGVLRMSQQPKLEEQLRTVFARVARRMDTTPPPWAVVREAQPEPSRKRRRLAWVWRARVSSVTAIVTALVSIAIGAGALALLHGHSRDSARSVANPTAATARAEPLLHTLGVLRRATAGVRSRSDARDASSADQI